MNSLGSINFTYSSNRAILVMYFQRHRMKIKVVISLLTEVT